MDPMISIVCALYNYREYIVNLVQSVLHQTYPHWELMIVDDASTDSPEKVLNQFSDSRIHYIKLEKNHGYSFARNIGILQSKGEFIVIADADDMLTKNSIEVRLKALLAHPENLWCHADGKKMDTYGRVIQKEKKRGTRMERYGTQESNHRQIHGGSIMARREFYKLLGLYDEDLKFSSDNEMHRRAILFGVVPLYVQKLVTYYRQHPNQMHRSPEKRKIIDSRVHIDIVKEQIVASVEKRFQEGINVSNTKLLY